MLKVKGAGSKERKAGGKAEKIAHGSLGILGLQMHTKLDDKSLTKLNVGTFEKEAEQRVTRQIDFKLRDIEKNSSPMNEVVSAPYHNIEVKEQRAKNGSAEGSKLHLQSNRGNRDQ